MRKKLHKTARNTSFNDSLDLVIGTIGKVGDSPAGINKNFVIERVD
jgi:hypothetical protein